MSSRGSADSRIIMGVNLSHDISCAVLVGGEIKVAIENERLSRIKYDCGESRYGRLIPFQAIHYCCDYLGIRPEDVDLFVVDAVFPGADDLLASQLLGIPRHKIIQTGKPGHHLCHAYSAFYCSPFDEAAVAVVDTMGGLDVPFPGKSALIARQENYSLYHGNGRALEVRAKDWIHPGETGIGQLYTLYSALLQLTYDDTPGPDHLGNDCPLAAGGKLMGYAAWDRGRTAAPALLRERGSHLVEKNQRLIRHIREKGFVTAEARGAPYGSIWARDLRRFARFAERGGASLRDPRYLSLAGEAQRLLEKAILRIAELAHERTGSRNICLAGGTALNVIACSRILEESPFRNIFIQPAAGDAGNAIGAAFFGYYQHFRGKNRIYRGRKYSTLLGREYADAEVAKAIELFRARQGGFSVRKLPASAQVEAALSHLHRGGIVAIAKGRSEFGPRALGNRSFVAPPGSRSMVRKMNALKGREWYRPVAPVVLEEALHEYFDAPFDSAPFMNLSARPRAETKRKAPAICHVDGTARVQTVSRDENPFLHSLVKAYGKSRGVPILVNSSFNVSGEPIVETPADALRSFLGSPLVSCLLVGGYCLEKESSGEPSRRASKSS